MAGAEEDIKEDLQPRSLKFLLALWFAFLFYSCYKGLKYFRWPQPLTYRGLAIVVGVGVVLYLLWCVSQSAFWRRRWLVLLSGDITPPPGELESRSRQWESAGWFAFGLILLGASFAWLEWRDPYFFTQDDNLSQFLPVILQGSESLLSRGQLATYNPHQFAGAPTASIGTYALTYPGTYLSYWIARDLLSAPTATIDVFCILHFIYGYPILFALLKRIGCGSGVAVAGALAFLLQGFFLINGRSWFYMAPTALWVPVLFLLAERLRQGQASRLWPLGTGLAIGAYFHSGNVQMWIYGMALWALFLLIWLLTGRLAWRSLMPIAASLVVGLGVSLPLFVPQFIETSSAKRIIDGAAIDWTLLGLYFPWPLFKAEPAGPALFGALNRQYIGQFMYSGTLFMVAATLVVGSMIVHRWNRKTWGENAAAPLAFLAFAGALGQMGLIWFIFSKLPIFSKFAHPFKLLPLLTFLAILSGAAAIERVLRRSRRRALLETSLCLVVIALLAYHVSLPLPAAFTYGFKPFPRPLDGLKPASGAPQQRVIPLAPYRHGGEFYGRMPANNLPTVQGLYSILGYDPIVMRSEPALTMLGNLGHVETYTKRGAWMPTFWRERPLDEKERAERIAALRAYGIDTIFSFGSALRPPYAKGELTYIFYRGDQFLWQMLEAVRALPEEERTIVSNTNWGVIYRITGADPLAFLERDKPEPQKIEFHTRGADVSLIDAQAGDHLIVNIIDEPGRSFLRVYIDGQPVAHQVDSWKRVRVKLPADAKHVAVRYEPPFLKWLVVGAGFIVVGAIAGFFFGRVKSVAVS